MSTNMAGPMLALGAAACLGLGAVLFLVAGTSDSRVDNADAVEGVEGSAGSVELRLARLEQEVADLRSEVAGLRAGGGRRPGSGRPGLPGDSARRRGSVRGGASLSEVGSSGGGRLATIETEEEREELSTAIRDEWDRMREERWAARRERQAERAEVALDELDQELGLGGATRDALSGMLAEERERVSEIFQESREAGDFEAARTRIEELRLQTDAAAAARLEDEQLDAWLELREEGDLSSGPGFGRR